MRQEVRRQRKGRETRPGPHLERGRLDHGANRRAGAEEGHGGDQQQGSVARDHHVFARSHTLSLDHVLAAAGGDDTRQGPSRKGQGAVGGAGCDDDGVGPDPARIVSGSIGQHTRIGCIPDHAIRQIVKAGMVEDLEQPPRPVDVGERTRKLAKVLPARLAVVVHQHDGKTVVHRLARGGETRGPRADDGNVSGLQACGPRRDRVSTVMPGAAGVMQARTPASPSTTTVHSRQTPIPQK